MTVIDWLATATIIALLALYLAVRRNVIFLRGCWDRERRRRKSLEETVDELRDEVGSARAELALAKCPRCRSARVGRFCGNCGAGDYSRRPSQGAKL